MTAVRAEETHHPYEDSSTEPQVGASMHESTSESNNSSFFDWKSHKFRDRASASLTQGTVFLFRTLRHCLLALFRSKPECTGCRITLIQHSG